MPPVAMAPWHLGGVSKLWSLTLLPLKEGESPHLAGGREDLEEGFTGELGTAQGTLAEPAQRRGLFLVALMQDAGMPCPCPEPRAPSLRSCSSKS